MKEKNLLFMIVLYETKCKGKAMENGGGIISKTKYPEDLIQIGNASFHLNHLTWGEKKKKVITAQSSKLRSWTSQHFSV